MPTQLKQKVQDIGQNKIRQRDLVVKNGKLYLVLIIKKAYCLVQELGSDKLKPVRIEELKFIS